MKAPSERFAGDGLLVLFNDPIAHADHTERAVRMALAMQEDVDGLVEKWRAQGHDLGFGIGIARGFATLGQVGFERRFDYAAIGTVTNLAARLCAEARAGQILVSQKVASVIDGQAATAPMGELTLKGFARKVPVFAVSRAQVQVPTE